MRVKREVAAGLVLGLMLLTATSPAVPEEYTVSSGDILDITVLGEPSVTGPQTVSPEGTIVLSFVGQVGVAGLTLSQVTTKLTTELGKFIRNPQVVVSVRQASLRRHFVYLLGQVARTGAYEMQKDWTLAELLAVAGGPTPGAALPRALILRKSTTIPVDLEQLLVEGNAAANVPLEPGDVVIVPETKNRVVLMGEVAKPGPYLFRSDDRIVDILSAAGGPTPKASLSDIGIIRQQGPKTSVTHVDLDKFYKNGDISQNAPLQPGDIVYVPGRGGVTWDSFLQTLTPLTYLFLLLR